MIILTALCKFLYLVSGQTKKEAYGKNLVK